MRVRKFQKEDLPAVIKIQKENLAAAQWLLRDYEGLAEDPHALLLVAELETTTPAAVVAFAAIHDFMDEAEIRNIAVAREHQRRGIGGALLAEARKRLTEAGARKVFLEVRASNRAALELYQRARFALHSRRKGYYRDPEEDALVLGLVLSPPPAPPA